MHAVAYNFVAGRGHVKRDGDAFSDAERILKKPKQSRQELVQIIKQMIREHEALRSRYDKLATVHNRACALLQEKYQMGQDAEEDMRRRGAVTDLIGEGYDIAGRTFRRHRALAMGYVKRLAGEHLN